MPHPNSVDFAQFCPDGRSLLTTCYDGFARQWSLDDVDRSLSVWSTPIKTPQNSTFANGAYSDDGRHFALFNDGHVGVWERGRVTHATGSVPWKGSSFLPRASADGRLVAPGARHSFTGTWTAEGDELIVVRSDDGQPAGPAIKLTGFLYDSCVCSDNRSAAAVTIAGDHSWLTVYDIESGEPRYPALELPAQPMSVAARPGIDEIAVLSRNGSLQVLDSRTGERKFEVQHEDWQDRDASHCRAVYSPDGQILVSVDFKSRVFVRDPQTGVARYRPLETVIAEGACRDVAFSRDSRRLATAAVGKNVVRVWDLATGEQAGQDLPHPGDIFGIWTVCFSPDGRHVMTAHKDGLLRIWDWMSGQLVDASMQNPDEVTDASYTADGQHIVAAVRLSAVHVWDVATRRLALPVVDDLFMPGDSAECVRIVGDRAVVTKGYKYYVLDMEKVLRVPHESLESLLRRAELATSTRLRGSDLMRLTPADWTERWEQELASRSAPAVREQPSHPARSGESPQESQ